MTYQTVVIGSYTFTDCELLNPKFLAAVQAAKQLGVNRASMFTYGARGVIPIYIRGHFTGVSGKTNLWTVIGELESKTVKRLKADFLAGVDLYGYVSSVSILDQAGWTKDGVRYTYPVELEFQAGLRSNLGDRGITWGRQDENDTFSLTRTPVVPLPVGYADSSETVDFSRYADDGAGSTNTIGCCLSPENTSITYTIATEASLEKNLVTVSRTMSGNIPTAFNLTSGFVKVSTCHGAVSNRGYIPIQYYNGTAWIALGNLRVWLSMSGGSGYQEVTASTPAPDTHVLWSGHPERQTLWMKYPATATDSIEAVIMVEVQRGCPYLKVTVGNATATAMTGCYYRLAVTPTDFRYWTHSETEEDAQSGEHGTPDVVTGDSDAVNASWLHTTAGAPTAATILAGFARKKQADSDDVADDAVNYWDYIEQRFDSVTINKGYEFEPVWLFAGRYDKIGSRTAAQLGSEILSRVTLHQGIIPRT